MAALARQAGLTQNYLARRFREHFGCTLHGYQLARRIEHASQLLESTDMPIARIAERLGFSDAQHFNKQFRRLLSASPTSFRAGRHARRAPGPGAPPPDAGSAGADAPRRGP